MARWRCSRKPACTSQVRVLDTSLSERGTALVRGSSMRSLRSLMELFGTCAGRSKASDLSRSPSTDEGAYAATPNEKVATTTAMTKMLASTVSILNLYSNNSSDHKVSNRL